MIVGCTVTADGKTGTLVGIIGGNAMVQVPGEGTLVFPAKSLSEAGTLVEDSPPVQVVTLSDEVVVGEEVRIDKHLIPREDGNPPEVLEREAVSIGPKDVGTLNLDDEGCVSVGGLAYEVGFILPQRITEKWLKSRTIDQLKTALELPTLKPVQKEKVRKELESRPT